MSNSAKPTVNLAPREMPINVWNGEFNDEYYSYAIIKPSGNEFRHYCLRHLIGSYPSGFALLWVHTNDQSFLILKNDSSKRNYQFLSEPLYKTR